MAIGIAPSEPDTADARKRRRDMRALWRLCGWGGSAAIALAAVAIITQTESGNARLQAVFGAGDQLSRAAEKDAEAQRLEAQMRVLVADRERLATRIEGLERNLDDVTGSLKRQVAEAQAAAIVKSKAPATMTPPPAMLGVDTAMPTPSAPDQPAPTVGPLAMAAGTDGAAPGTPPPQAPTAEPPVVPLPQPRIAAVPPASEAAAGTSPPLKSEFGVELGSAPNIEALRTRWAAVKANFGPLLAGMYPVAANDHRPGAVTFRLVVGPLPSVADAARLCAHFTAARAACHTAKFDGQKLAQQ